MSIPFGSLKDVESYSGEVHSRKIPSSELPRRPAPSCMGQMILGYLAVGLFLLLLALLGSMIFGCAPSEYYTHWHSGRVDGKIVERKPDYDVVQYTIDGQTYIGVLELPPAARLKMAVGSSTTIYWWTDVSFIPHAPVKNPTPLTSLSEKKKD